MAINSPIVAAAGVGLAGVAAHLTLRLDVRLSFPRRAASTHAKSWPSTSDGHDVA